MFFSTDKKLLMDALPKSSHPTCTKRWEGKKDCVYTYTHIYMCVYMYKHDCMLMDRWWPHSSVQQTERLKNNLRSLMFGGKKNVLTDFLIFFYPRLIPQGITVKSRVRIISGWFLWLCALKHDASPHLACGPPNVRTKCPAGLD